MKSNKNTWFDDPEWEDLRRKINKEPPLPKLGKKPKVQGTGIDGFSRRPNHPNPAQPTNPISSEIKPVPEQEEDKDKKVQVSLNVTLPKIKRPVLAKKQQRIGIVLVAVVMLLAVAPKIRDTVFKKDTTATQGASVDVPQTPQFTPVLPDSLLEATTSKKTQYDPQKRVVSFTDTINAVEITVSEQAMPDALKENPQAEVEKIAKNFSANEVVETKSGKAYVGTSADGPQSVVLTKKNLLIFIYSKSKIENKSWASYVDSLL